jgi:ATP/maltotriose-dependent transcriptional regulator MalT
VTSVLALTQMLERLATEYGFPMFEASAMIHRGWALFEQGQYEQAVMHMRDGLVAQQATGQRASHGFYMGCLAEAYERSGALDRAFTTLQDALEVSEEEVWKPGLLCARAAISARHGVDVDTLATTYQDALGLARRQGAKMYELLASTSLTRLLRTAEARQELAALYASFTEGFDTYELREAKHLLEELDGPVPKFP